MKTTEGISFLIGVSFGAALMLLLLGGWDDWRRKREPPEEPPPSGDELELEKLGEELLERMEIARC